MAFATCLASCGGSQKEVYKDPSAPVKDRVEDLLGRMTLEEKVGQMNQFVGLEHIKANSAVMTEEELKNNTANAFYPGITEKDVAAWTEQGLIGSFLHVLTLKEANYLQSLAMKSRLQIPILFGIDAIHGNANAPDNTVYPTNINLACSFDTAMAYKIARETAREMRAMNMHWTFNPNVEVARDARWGRVGETYGEDPYLVSRLGVATVEGYQQNLDSDKDVLACIKHFAGGSEPINGTNGAPTDLSERTLREVFFPPFKAGVDAGAFSLMTAHNELNGIPCHENEWLMQEVLRGEWGFRGFVVSDWMDIEHVHDLHGTAETVEDAYRQSITAGMDMHMHGPGWDDAVCQLVRDGVISEERIDESVRRILTMKFRLGLFEHPYADEAKTMQVRLCQEHRRTALEAARQSIVLLKNSGLLPLDAKRVGKILVTGINANDENIMGDWSAQQRAENVICFPTFCSHNGITHRTQNLLRQRELHRQFLRHALTVCLVGRNSLMPEGRCFQVKRKRNRIRLLLAQRFQYDIEKSENRIRKYALVIRQRLHTIKCTVQDAVAVNAQYFHILSSMS